MKNNIIRDIVFGLWITGILPWVVSCVVLGGLFKLIEVVS